eukprot:4893205-Pyramimonas_sp.AAC.1
MGRRRRANHAIGAFGGSPRGATKGVRSAPKRSGTAMRTLPLGPPGSRTVFGVHQNETAPPSTLCNWGHRWGPLWGHEPCERCATMGRRRHANFANLAVGGCHHGATNRVSGAPKWTGAAMRTLPVEP